MKKYWIAQWVSWRYIGKLNKKWNMRLDKEPLLYNDVMQLFEAMGKYIANFCSTKVWDETTIKSNGKKIISFTFHEQQNK